MRTRRHNWLDRRLPIYLLTLSLFAASVRDVAYTGAASTIRWVPNGPVYAVAADHDTLYIGGDFWQVGPLTGSFVTLDATSAQHDPAFPQVAGVIRAVADDGQGGWYIGGAFTAVDNQPRANLAHILADGRLDPQWKPAADGPVLALAVRGPVVYAGGLFTRIDQAERASLAALDAASGAALPWSVAGNGQVYTLALAQNGSTLYAGGDFTSIGTQERQNLAAFDLASGAIAPWQPQANSSVLALAVAEKVLYAGGNFTQLDGRLQPFVGSVELAPAPAPQVRLFLPLVQR